MQYDEILEMVITELTERGQKQQRSENPEIDELVLRRTKLSEQVQECVSPLSQDAREILAEYHNTMDILSGDQIRYLYLQGAKDCVSLLRELGVIR